MMICKDYYVCNKLGEIFKVTQIRNNRVSLVNLKSGDHEHWFTDVIAPLFIQKGDKFQITYANNIKVTHELVSVLWDGDFGDYMFKLKTNYGAEDTFTRTDLAEYIDNFTE